MNEIVALTSQEDRPASVSEDPSLHKGLPLQSKPKAHFIVYPRDADLPLKLLPLPVCHNIGTNTSARSHNAQPNTPANAIHARVLEANNTEYGIRHVERLEAESLFVLASFNAQLS